MEAFVLHVAGILRRVEAKGQRVMCYNYILHGCKVGLDVPSLILVNLMCPRTMEGQGHVK